MKSLRKEDIQGNIVRGYTFAHAVHLFFSIENPAGARAFLRKLKVTSAEMWPRDGAGNAIPPEHAINVGFTYAGLSRLRKCTDMAVAFPAFAEGMLARAKLLGDYELLENAVPREHVERVRELRQRWLDVDLWVALYASDKGKIEQLADQLKTAACPALRCVHERSAAAILKDDRPYEHFGFQDNISNPLIEGAYEADERAPVPNVGRGKVEREGEPRAIRAGEFVLGYEDESGASGQAAFGDLTKFVENGTFVVLRQLEQDVAGFRAYVREKASESGQTEDQLCAWIVGRARDGTPLAKPDADKTLNNFGYADDRAGARCPVGAHIRRAHPRDASGVVDGSHRIVRRGMPYGAPLPEEPSEDEKREERGLLFIAINASIERQFEFVQTKWINGTVGLASKQDRDPLVGAHLGSGTMVVQGDAEKGRPPLLLNGLPRFVHCRGGAYFFMPGLEALSSLIKEESTRPRLFRPGVPLPRGQTPRRDPPQARNGIADLLERAFSPVKRRVKQSLENIEWGRRSVTELVAGLKSDLGTRALTTLLPTLLERIELSGLAIRQFTAVLPLASRIDPHLRETLRRIDAQLTRDCALEPDQKESVFAKVPGLHSARIMLLEEPQTSPLAPSPRTMRSDDSEPGQSGVATSLVLNLVFDGSLDDVLTTLFEGSHELQSVFGNCARYPRYEGVERCVAYLKKARLRGGYFFSDIPDASRAEIDEAAELWQAFQQFHSEHQGKLRDGDNAALQEAFKRFCHEHDLRRVPLSQALERPLPDEARWVRRAVELAQRGQRRDARARRRAVPESAPMRAVHVKHHGCIEAKFQVPETLPERFVRGIFRPGASYQALIRLSNSSHRAQADAASDGRGMAIKLLGVDPTAERAFDANFTQGVSKLEDIRTQDFVLLSNPTFFAKDIRDFAIMTSLLEADAESEAERLGRLAVYCLRRPREASILLSTLWRRVDHPLDLAYHSATPYLFGQGMAVKYSVRPRLLGKKSYAPCKPDRKDANYLRRALKESLAPSRDEPIELDFCIHVSPSDRQLPIEDARENWEKLGAAPIPLATIVIAPQNFATPDNDELCERLVFNPWNALKDHKPLGSLNRARLAIYRASAGARGGRDQPTPTIMRNAHRAANGVQPSRSPEPSSPAVGPDT